MSNELSATMIIFGATGDLTHRKLIPALHQLKFNKFLPDNFAVIAIGRKDKTDDQYRKELLESLKKHTTLLIDEESWISVIQRVFYLKMDFLDPAEYAVLKNLLGGMNNDCGLSNNYLFYLAVAPDYIGSIVNNLQSEGILSNKRGWHRLVIEKPFGSDLESAYNLNDEITSVFNEDEIYRIDHYLAKEMIQNITMLRFQNSIFEPLWNREYIDNVQITVYEKEGVGTRGGYYDKTGALRDMVQNHLLQSLAITAMDPPKSMEANDIRDQKVKLMSNLIIFDNARRKEDVVIGQYESYTSEENIPKNSKTETFVAMKLEIDNDRWRGVPFYLMTGKMLPERSAQVTIEFKVPSRLNGNSSQGTSSIYELNENSLPNILEVKIQPKEGIHLRLNTKKPAVVNETVIAEMEYCQSCQYNYNSPDSYEKLLRDVMLGDSTRFTRWDELALSWYFIDSIKQELSDLKIYSDCSHGPVEADSLLMKDGRKWWHRDEEGGEL